jgi:uncharacterized damage-inducible protein DinB
MDDKIAAEFINESSVRFDGSFNRLFHCLAQLNDEQIWRQPNENVNSIGVLVKHICGSFRQWTITPLNNAEDLRNRPEEFLNDDGITKSDLISLAEKLKSDFADAIGKLDAARLTEPRRIQGWELTLMTAIFRALTHLEGHVGQIVTLTRIELGNDYKIFWTPQTDEQKSERK